MDKATRVQFVVDDFGDDASEITNLIGFAPSSVTVAGFSSFPKRVAWLLELPDPVPDDITEHVAAFVQFLDAHAEHVRNVAIRFRARISIVVDDRDWISAHDPDGPRFATIDLPPELAASVARLKVGFIFHVWSGLESEASRSG